MLIVSDGKPINCNLEDFILDGYVEELYRYNNETIRANYSTAGERERAFKQ